ncbi:MAG: hypothetical protein H6618_08790 [Deltaproteobacteria bacterium]|nr:hypothetical protein [Deltaproteobacteria bacterium]
MSEKPTVIVIDDDEFHLGNIKIELAEFADVHGYHPRDLDDIEDFEPFRQAEYALIDWHFKSHTAIDNRVVEFIRANGFRGKALICSLHNIQSERKEIQETFDGILQKDGLTWDNILKF